MVEIVPLRSTLSVLSPPSRVDERNTPPYGMHRHPISSPPCFGGPGEPGGSRGRPCYSRPHPNNADPPTMSRLVTLILCLNPGITSEDRHSSFNLGNSKFSFSSTRVIRTRGHADGAFGVGMGSWGTDLVDIRVFCEL
eukprot:1349403-Amorphochlora_amoeboformis.AAC.1